MRRAVFHASGQQERLFHARFALVHGDPVFQGGGILDDAGREVGHHVIAFGGDAFGGFNHFRDRSALDMGDIDAGAGGQQGAEILDLGGGAGHHLDRVALQEGLDMGGGGFCLVAFALEIQQSHRGLQ